VSRVVHARAESGFSRAGPALAQLHTDWLDSAIKVLARFLEVFRAANFHPLAAQVTRILALLTRAAGSIQSCME
jgi:hypothetical protein